MTRREFLEQMLISTFSIKGIEYLNNADGVVLYSVGGTVYRDCTYSYSYKNKFIKFWKVLFDSDNKEVAIKSSKIKKSNIEIYQNKAKEYILQLVSSNAKSSVVSKENLTPKATEYIYINIILEELFKIESPSKDRGKDDFSSSLEKIKNEIVQFIPNNYQYVYDFFNDIIKKYPIFSKLQLDEKNKLVSEDIVGIKKFIKYSKTPLPTVNLELLNLTAIKKETLERNGTLARYIDKPSMEAVEFEMLTSVIIELYSYSESYPKIFKEKEIEALMNTAIRAYNHFYGRNHVVYSGKADNSHWGMHQHLTLYIFMLQLVMESKQITDCDEKKVKE